MHGTGPFDALRNLMVGGASSPMVGRRFDPVELLDTSTPADNDLDRR